MNLRTATTGMVLGLTVLAAGAAAQTLVMPRSRILPAAQARVRLGTDRNGNTKVDLQVEHMAAPSSLTPPRQFYVVWVHPAGRPMLRQGVLMIQGGLDGELKFITSARSFTLLITAEDTREPPAPSATVVMEGTLARAQ